MTTYIYIVYIYKRETGLFIHSTRGFLMLTFQQPLKRVETQPEAPNPWGGTLRWVCDAHRDMVDGVTLDEDRGLCPACELSKVETYVCTHCNGISQWFWNARRKHEEVKPCDCTEAEKRERCRQSVNEERNL